MLFGVLRVLTRVFLHSKWVRRYVKPLPSPSLTQTRSLSLPMMFMKPTFFLVGFTAWELPCCRRVDKGINEVVFSFFFPLLSHLLQSHGFRVPRNGRACWVPAFRAGFTIVWVVCCLHRTKILSL